MRKQNLCIFIFQELFIIAVTDDTTDCFVKGCLMLRLSKTVKKDKISISVHNSFTMNIKQFLSFFFHKECFFDEIQHRNLAFSSRSFRGIDIKITATLASLGTVVIVNQCVVHINYTFFQINIAPSETRRFSNTKPCSNQHCKNRIPQTCRRCILQITQEQFLFRSR